MVNESLAVLCILMGLLTVLIMGYLILQGSQDKTIFFLLMKVTNLQQKLKEIKAENDQLYIAFAKISESVDKVLKETTGSEETIKNDWK